MVWRITLRDRGGQRLDAPAEATLLTSLRAAGVSVLAGCEAGACRTCAARLIEGRVSHPPSSLTSEMIEAGVVLPCVAQPRSDCTLQLGKPGRTLLSPGHLIPWQE